MSAGYLLAKAAIADGREIWDYLAMTDSVEAADRVLASLRDECEKLSVMPGMGHYREDLLDRQYRCWRVWSYLIVYRWQVKPIQIIAFVHGSRDLMRFLNDRGKDPVG